MISITEILLAAITGITAAIAFLLIKIGVKVELWIENDLEVQRIED